MEKDKPSLRYEKKKKFVQLNVLAEIGNIIPFDSSILPTWYLDDPGRNTFTLLPTVFLWVVVQSPTMQLILELDNFILKNVSWVDTANLSCCNLNHFSFPTYRKQAKCVSCILFLLLSWQKTHYIFSQPSLLSITLGSLLRVSHWFSKYVRDVQPRCKLTQSTTQLDLHFRQLCRSFFVVSWRWICISEALCWWLRQPWGNYSDEDLCMGKQWLSSRCLVLLKMFRCTWDICMELTDVQNLWEFLCHSALFREFPKLISPAFSWFVNELQLFPLHESPLKCTYLIYIVTDSFRTPKIKYFYCKYYFYILMTSVLV